MVQWNFQPSRNLCGISCRCHYSPIWEFRELIFSSNYKWAKCLWLWSKACLTILLKILSWFDMNLTLLKFNSEIHWFLINSYWIPSSVLTNVAKNPFDSHDFYHLFLIPNMIFPATCNVYQHIQPHKKKNLLGTGTSQNCVCHPPFFPPFWLINIEQRSHRAFSDCFSATVTATHHVTVTSIIRQDRKSPLGSTPVGISYKHIRLLSILPPPSTYFVIQLGIPDGSYFDAER